MSWDKSMLFTDELYQISVFDILQKPFKIDKPIRLIELFAGIGSQAKALQRLGADYEHYRVCEYDKYAIKSYNAIHGTDFATSDITQLTANDLGIVDTDKYCYIMTYSFPCQDLSLAGKQKGMAKGENTRSGLLWEVERLLNECEHLPQVLLMENVTQVHGKKNKEHFDEWIRFLESKGYSNYWQDLNAKNFGIPQNRNRTFMVSVLGDYTYEFPKEFPLELRLKDMLEKEVDEKFYLDGKALEYINKRVGVYTQICDEKTETTKCAITAKGNQNWTGNFITEQPMLIGGMQENQSVKTDGISTTLTSSMGTGGGYVPMVTEPKCEQVGMLSGGKWDRMHDVSRRVYSGDGVAPTLHTCGGGNTEPKITEPLALDEQNGYIRKCGTVVTLTTDGSSPKHNNRVIEGARIRKLTPKECFRLMGFDDADFDKAAELNSNSQLYKQAGNSIVVDVLYYIFKEMF